MTKYTVENLSFKVIDALGYEYAVSTGPISIDVVVTDPNPTPTPQLRLGMNYKTEQPVVW